MASISATRNKKSNVVPGQPSLAPPTTVPYPGLIPVSAESAILQSMLLALMPIATTPLVHGSYGKPATTISVDSTISHPAMPNMVFSLAPYGAEAGNLPPFKQLPKVIDFYLMLSMRY